MNTFASDIRTLRQLLLHPIRGRTHQERLESFYAAQACNYDSFRERMLHGRRELMRSVTLPPAGSWADLGCGTGQNLEFADASLQHLSHVDLVDLSTSMLAVAEQRVERLRCTATGSFPTVRLHQCDATRTAIADRSMDLVTMSYSLTMIPDWFSAIDEAVRMLKPGGQIAVVDFYVSRKFTDHGMKRHGWFARQAWPIWFSFDNVYLSPDHLPMLANRFETENLVESRGSLPFLPLLKVPHYRFLGRKSSADVDSHLREPTKVDTGSCT